MRGEHRGRSPARELARSGGGARAPEIYDRPRHCSKAPHQRQRPQHRLKTTLPLAERHDIEGGNCGKLQIPCATHSRRTKIPLKSFVSGFYVVTGIAQPLNGTLIAAKNRTASTSLTSAEETCFEQDNASTTEAT